MLPSAAVHPKKNPAPTALFRPERRAAKAARARVIPAKRRGLAAAVYTQLSDVEDEVNGFVTYDRKKVKLDPESVAEINAKLRD